MTPLLILPVFFLVGCIAWLYSGSGPSARRVRAGHVSVACPNCGARGELIAGQPAQVCGYCGTALVASAPLMERGIDAAELAYRRARLEEFRQEEARYRRARPVRHVSRRRGSREWSRYESGRKIVLVHRVSCELERSARSSLVDVLLVGSALETGFAVSIVLRTERRNWSPFRLR